MNRKIVIVVCGLLASASLVARGIDSSTQSTKVADCPIPQISLPPSGAMPEAAVQAGVEHEAQPPQEAAPVILTLERAKPEHREPRYPHRKTWWYAEFNGGRYYLMDHVHLTQGEHEGQFDLAWLKSLDFYELNALHSDAHDGRVDWDYAMRGAGVAKPKAVAKPQGRWEQVKVCNSRSCRLQWKWVAE